MLSRRSMLMALSSAMAGRGAKAHASGPTLNTARRVAVAFSSALEPCVEAVDGMRARAAGVDMELIPLDLNKSSFTADAAAEMARKPGVLVTAGSDALRAISAFGLPARIISTMTLASDRQEASANQVAAAVYLDIPIRSQIMELRRIFPSKTRIGVIRNPGRGGEALVSLHTPAAETGALEIADCAGAQELLPAFLGFRKKADFVICLPDSSLYNSATVRPLIMASLENRLPIVGFSPAFARAGAAAAIFPDYRTVGEQTVEIVQRCLDGGNCRGWETPRKLGVAVNTRVLRMLGLDFRPEENADLVVLR